MTPINPHYVTPPGPDREGYAEETVELAESLWDYIFPPRRWPEWWRRHRIVKQRIRLLQETRR